MLRTTTRISMSLAASRFATSAAVSSSNNTSAAATAGTGPSVLLSQANRCAIVQLNRPKALNALNAEMVRSIYPALQHWDAAGGDQTPAAALVLIKSGLAKAFCAGGDVRSAVTNPVEQAYAFFRDEYTLVHLIGTLRMPYVALIDGITMGGGVGLSVHGRYRVATERTTFAMPETFIGLFPDVGGSHFLPRLSGELGTFLGLTSTRLAGWDVLSAGIATHYCPSRDLDDLQRALHDCASDRDVQAALRQHCAADAERPAFSLAANQQQIDRCFAADTVEEIVANLRSDESDWAAKTLKALQPASPLSLKVTLRMLRAGRGLSLADCLRMEYRMVRRHCEDSDFKEGVEAMLIRKDNAPKWKFQRLEDVPVAVVERFFAPLERNEDELRLYVSVYAIELLSCNIALIIKKSPLFSFGRCNRGLNSKL